MEGITYQAHIKLIAKKGKDLLQTNISIRPATSNIQTYEMSFPKYAKANPDSNITIISLDTETAFDSVSFSWLSIVLKSFVFSGPFLHLISTMYTNPSANIVAAVLISKPIKLHKGTRQGCPLSPLLFNLTLEPLSCHIPFSPLSARCTHWSTKSTTSTLRG